MPTNTVPTPTWHGSPGDVVDRYAAFVKRHTAAMRHTRPAELESTITNNERIIRRYKTYITDTRDVITGFKAKIDELEKSQTAVDDELIAQRYLRLIAMPEVIGTRLGSYGELVIVFRPIHESGCDLGDFELDSSFFGTEQRVLQVRSPQGDGRPANAERYSAVAIGGLSMYSYCVYLDTPGNDLLKLLREYDLESIIRLICGCLTAFTRNVAAEETERAAPNWEGFEPDGVDALRRLAFASDGYAYNERLAALKANITRSERNIEANREQIPSLQTEIRLARAELSKLRQLGDTNELDMEGVREELLFITTGIPGVMGMRFEPDGTPVVHMRSTFEFRGRRYDLGDFEIFFRKHLFEGNHAIKIHQTRLPLGGRQSGSYWHPGGNFAYGPNDYDWFCFGSRRETIVNLFENGEFGHFLNVVVGTMNSANAGYEEDFVRSYREIPFDEVWKNKPRRRPRRSRAALALALATVALRS